MIFFFSLGHSAWSSRANSCKPMMSLMFEPLGLVGTSLSRNDNTWRVCRLARFDEARFVSFNFQHIHTEHHSILSVLGHAPYKSFFAVQPSIKNAGSLCAQGIAKK